MGCELSEIMIGAIVFLVILGLGLVFALSLKKVGFRPKS